MYEYQKLISTRLVSPEEWTRQLNTFGIIWRYCHQKFLISPAPNSTLFFCHRTNGTYEKNLTPPPFFSLAPSLAIALSVFQFYANRAHSVDPILSISLPFLLFLPCCSVHPSVHLTLKTRSHSSLSPWLRSFSFLLSYNNLQICIVFAKFQTFSFRHCDLIPNCFPSWFCLCLLTSRIQIQMRQAFWHIFGQSWSLTLNLSWPFSFSI